MTKLDWSPWVPPFHYLHAYQQILDSRDVVLLDMRGWGFLTGHGSAGLRIPPHRAAEIQDHLGLVVAAMLSGSAAPPENYHPWQAPFRYNEQGQWIEDSNGQRLFDMPSATDLENDRISRQVVDLLNSASLANGKELAITTE